MASYFQNDPAGELNADDYTYFSTAKQRVRDQYNLSNAQGNYQQDTLKNQYNRSYDDLKRQYAQMRDRLPGGFAKRGLLNSGIYQKAIADFGTERTAASQNLTGQYNDQYNGALLAQQQLESVRANSLNDIETQEVARRASAAAALKSAQGYQ